MMPIVRTLLNWYDPSSWISTINQSSCFNRGVAFKIPAHIPATLVNVETETGVDGGGGTGSIGAHPNATARTPTIIRKQAVRSHSFIIVSSSTSLTVNCISVLSERPFYNTPPSAVYLTTAVPPRTERWVAIAPSLSEAARQIPRLSTERSATLVRLYCSA